MLTATDQSQQYQPASSLEVLDCFTIDAEDDLFLVVDKENCWHPGKWIGHVREDYNIPEVTAILLTGEDKGRTQKFGDETSCLKRYYRLTALEWRESIG